MNPREAMNFLELVYCSELVKHLRPPEHRPRLFQLSYERRQGKMATQDQARVLKKIFNNTNFN